MSLCPFPMTTLNYLTVFLSDIRDSRKARTLWGMMRGVGGVRKSIHQSWLAKRLGLGLLCWGFKGVRKKSGNLSYAPHTYVFIKLSVNYFLFFLCTCGCYKTITPQGFLGMLLNCIWWWSSSDGSLGNIECHFIAITPRSTLTRAGVPVRGMNQIYRLKNYLHLIEPCAKKLLKTPSESLLRNFVIMATKSITLGPEFFSINVNLV